MVEDARFEEGGEAPLALKAFDVDDLRVISALTQDAVFPLSEIRWEARRRRFALLLNRFRWEDVEADPTRGRDYERVQSVLAFEDVLGVASHGIEPGDPDTVASLLDIGFEPGNDGGGRVILTLAGDGAIALTVETIEATLKDVTRPYLALSRLRPRHPE